MWAKQDGNLLAPLPSVVPAQPGSLVDADLAVGGPKRGGEEKESREEIAVGFESHGKV